MYGHEASALLKYGLGSEVVRLPEAAAPPVYGRGSEGLPRQVYGRGSEGLPRQVSGHEAVALLEFARGIEVAPLSLYAREVVGRLEHGHDSARAASNVAVAFVKATRLSDRVDGEESVDLFHGGGTLQWLKTGGRK